MSSRLSIIGEFCYWILFLWIYVFTSVSIDQITNFIKSPKVKTCAPDPLPASVLTNSLPILLPLITDIDNCSLEYASLPVSLNLPWSVTPLLKKCNLNPEDFKNLCPVSNLPLVEKSAASQLVQYIEDNNLGEKF